MTVEFYKNKLEDHGGTVVFRLKATHSFPEERNATVIYSLYYGNIARRYGNTPTIIRVSYIWQVRLS